MPPTLQGVSFVRSASSPARSKVQNPAKELATEASFINDSPVKISPVKIQLPMSHFANTLPEQFADTLEEMLVGLRQLMGSLRETQGMEHLHTSIHSLQTQLEDKHGLLAVKKSARQNRDGVGSPDSEPRSAMPQALARAQARQTLWRKTAKRRLSFLSLVRAGSNAEVPFPEATPPERDAFRQPALTRGLGDGGDESDSKLATDSKLAIDAKLATESESATDSQLDSAVQHSKLAAVVHTMSVGSKPIVFGELGGVPPQSSAGREFRRVKEVFNQLEGTPPPSCRARGFGTLTSESSPLVDQNELAGEWDPTPPAARSSGKVPSQRRMCSLVFSTSLQLQALQQLLNQISQAKIRLL